MTGVPDAHRLHHRQPEALSEGDVEQGEGPLVEGGEDGVSTWPAKRTPSGAAARGEEPQPAAPQTTSGGRPSRRSRAAA